MKDFAACFKREPLLLTEGAVGVRLEQAYGLKPDKDIAWAATLYDKAGRAALGELYGQYLAVARRHGLPLMLLTNTRRANRERLARSAFADRPVMADYAAFLRGLAEGSGADAYIGGMLGSRGDGYSGVEGLCISDALAFHAWQVEAFEAADVDYLVAAIMPSLPEIIGLSRLMEKTCYPYIISLMVGEDGRLLDGHTIDEAIATVDHAMRRPPLCYISNCVHPRVLRQALAQPFNQTPRVRARLCGLQANAADLPPHALDGRAETATSTPEELLAAFIALDRQHLLRIMGGCCGTDQHHIEALAAHFGAAR